MKVPKIAQRYLNEYSERLPKWEEARYLIDRRSVCRELYLARGEVSLYSLHVTTGASVINLHLIVDELISMQVVERIGTTAIRLVDGGRKKLFDARRTFFCPAVPKVWTLPPPGITTTPNPISKRRKLPTSYKL